MIPRSPCATVAAAILLISHAAVSSASQSLADTVAKIKPSLVAIGTLEKTRSPPTIFTATGFAIADGRHVVTNAHTLKKEMNVQGKEALIVLHGGGTQPSIRPARILNVDRERDLALIQIDGPALPALEVVDSSSAREGQPLAFTGYPLGMALGMYPATHRATIAAIVPIARPGITSKQLNAPLVSRLRDSTYAIFQLDANAYPGNSGSPLYDPGTGQVYGIVNSAFVQGTREQAISRPSGITYAIPSLYILELLKQANLTTGR